MARRRSVGRSVCPSVNTSNSATNVWIFFEMGGNIEVFFIFKKFQFLNFLAPPAERQRSFSNADSSVVRRRPPSSSSTFHIK